MMLVRWQPFERMDALRRQLDQMFDEMTETPTRKEADWYPAVELIDTPDHLLLHIQLPGVDRNKIEIQAARDSVLISGEHSYPQQSKSEKANWLHSEFAYGKFRRLISLPVAIENNQVHANFQNGVLTLTLPKIAQARRHVVKVNLGESDDSASTATLEANYQTLQNGNSQNS